MRFLFKNEVVEYTLLGNENRDTILFLHGWGMSKSAFSHTIKLLEKNYSILTLTMPTIEPTISVWTLFDYVELVENILSMNNIQNLIVVCHSFGFRVAMLLNKRIKIKKIIVTGGAGIKKEKYLDFFKKINKNNIKILLNSKKIKNLFEKTASTDYKALSPTNRKTFINIVNLNLNFALKFNCPLLLFWGTKDSETPIWIAKQTHKKNTNAKLILTNSNHFAYIENNAQFNNETLKFLNQN